MTPATAVALGGLAIAVLIMVGAAAVWRRAGSAADGEPPAYVVSDAVEFIHNRLQISLRRPDVQRIVEWELFYLQGLAQKNRRQPVETVAGGVAPAIEFIADRISAKHGVAYALDDIRRVLELEAAYLFSIGAVGDPVQGPAEEAALVPAEVPAETLAEIPAKERGDSE